MLPQSLAMRQDLQQAAGRSGDAKGCSRLLQGEAGAKGCSRLLQSLARCEGLQQAAAKSGWVPRVAAGCGKAWLGAKGCSRLLQGLARCQGLQQAAARYGYVPRVAPRVAAGCCKVWLGAYLLGGGALSAPPRLATRPADTVFERIKAVGQGKLPACCTLSFLQCFIYMRWLWSDVSSTHGL
jgi:hypothetical protein